MNKELLCSFIELKVVLTIPVTDESEMRAVVFLNKTFKENCVENNVVMMKISFCMCNKFLPRRYFKSLFLINLCFIAYF